MRKTISILFFLFAFTAIAQQLNFPLNYEMQNRVERYISNSSHFITAAKPYNMAELQTAIGDSAMQELGFDTDSSKSGFKFGILKGDMLSVSTKRKKFYFAVNPVLDAQFGYDVNEKKLKERNDITQFLQVKTEGTSGDPEKESWKKEKDTLEKTMQEACQISLSIRS